MRVLEFAVRGAAGAVCQNLEALASLRDESGVKITCHNKLLRDSSLGTIA
jgi:hypothetical protein